MRQLFIFIGAITLAFAQPATAASSPALQSLEQELSFLIAGKSSDVGIAALDMTTGESISIRGETPYPMASTVKIAVAAAYLAQVDHDRRSLDDVIGGSSARTLLRKMLIYSDNPATDLLIRDLGGPDIVQSWINFHGLSGMRIDRTIAQLLSDRRDLWDTRDSATPLAMVNFLRTLDKGNVLSPSSRTFLFNLMAQCKTGRNRMKALLPAGTRVEHKTGTLNGLSDDVGFITMPDGRRIAVAIFARGGSDRPRTIAETARKLYDGFYGLFAWSMNTIPATR